MEWNDVLDGLPDYGTYRVNYLTKKGNRTVVFDAHLTSVSSVKGEEFDVWIAADSKTILDGNRVLHWYRCPSPPKV